MTGINPHAGSSGAKTFWQGAATRQRTVTITGTPTYSVSWDADSTPTAMTASATGEVTLSFTNTGSLSWQDTGSNPVHVSYQWLNEACPGASTADYDGLRTNLPGVINNGESVTDLAIPVEAPSRRAITA